MPNSNNSESEHAKHNEEHISKGRRRQPGTRPGSHEDKAGQSRQGGDADDKREESGRQGGKS
jgi:hypothetical protein